MSSSSLKLTARKRMASILSEEILSRSENHSFLIPSEHTLCRRFNISRVTVRLALSDLEAKGLIYRKHGKGTFAHGRSTRVQKGIAVLLKSPDSMGRWPISEMVRGMQNYQRSKHSLITFVTQSPKMWTSEFISSLAGVAIFPEDVVEDELEVLKNWKLPFLFATRTDLPGPQIHLGQLEAAQLMAEKLLLLGHQRLAMITGYNPNLDAPKREGIYQALCSAGLNPTQITEIIVSSGDEASLGAISKVLKHGARPTGWIAFDDSFGAMLNFCARQQGLNVPHDISIVSFHDFPYLRYLEPALTTVRFEFFAAGQLGVENLYRAYMTGEQMKNICFEPEYRSGQSVAHNHASSQ